MILQGRQPPYVPWSFSFTIEAREKLVRHYCTDDLETQLHNHIIGLGSDTGFFEDMGNDRFSFPIRWMIVSFPTSPVK